MAKKTTKNEHAGLELGLAAAGLAAVAGAIFLYGTDTGKSKRKEIKGWMIKARGEVVERLEKMKDVNEDTYHKVVDAVAAKYNSLKTVQAEDVAILVADLRKSWKDIAKVAKAKPAPKASAKKTTTKKSAPKKAAKKTSK